MVRLLEVPFQFPAVESQRDDGIRKKVDAGALGAVAEGVCDGHVEEAEIGINRRRFPDAAAMALTAHPCWAGNIPTLIFFVLRNRVEVPEHLACLCVDCKHMTTRDVAFAARRADVNHALVILWRRGEPVAESNRRLHLGESPPDHIEDDACLPVFAESWDRFSCFCVEREQKRSGCGVDDAFGVANAAITEDVAFAASTA